MKIQVLSWKWNEFQINNYNILNKSNGKKLRLAISEGANHFHDPKIKITVKKNFWQVKHIYNLHSVESFSQKKKRSQNIQKFQNYLLQNLWNISLFRSDSEVILQFHSCNWQSCKSWHEFIFMPVYLQLSKGNLRLHSSVDFFYLYWEMPREDG